MSLNGSHDTAYESEKKKKKTTEGESIKAYRLIFIGNNGGQRNMLNETKEI